MSDLKQAAMQALEALERADKDDFWREQRDAITALKAALEQPEQEPVGEVLNERGEIDYISYVPPVGTHLYTALRTALEQPAQGPTYKVTVVDNQHPNGVPYEQWVTSPAAQRPWQGLTEGERNDLEDYCKMTIGKTAFDAIEAKLKERNT